MPLADPARAVDELCDRFEQALQTGDGRPLDAWLAEAGSLAEQALPELVLLELDHRIRRGEPATAAGYFERFPGLAADPATAVRVVAAEFRALRKVGGPAISIDDLRQRHPELARTSAWDRGPWTSLAGGGDSTVRKNIRDDSTAPAERDPSGFLRELLTPPDRPSELGWLGDYRVLGVLGSGGMGVVLRAEEDRLGRPVALKLMWPDVAASSTARQRFLREARAAAAVEHPRVVVIFRVDEVNGVPFLAMPLLRGQSLAARLREGPLPRAEAVRLAREMAEGLAAAHERGLVHRDVKPDNVFLEQTPDGVHVRLLDFGLAFAPGGEPLTQAGQVVGTPAYMAPEQADARPATAKADLFSLGAVLYELVTGVRPFQRPSVLATVAALANHHPPPPREVQPSVPAALSDLILRLLEKDPGRRPHSREAVAALRAVEQEMAHVPALPTQILPPPAQRLPGRKWAAGAALAAALGVGALLAMRGRPAAENDVGEGVAAAPLRVVSFEVKRFPRLTAREAGPPAVLGRETFTARLGDQAEVYARLSRPAYAYLLAFRPDGVVELCFPEEVGEAPPRTDRPSYPFSAKSRDLRFQLEDGAGLYVFAVVATDEPLPPYREWAAGRPPPWPGAKGEPDAPPDRVWIDDGQWAEEIGPGGAVRDERGKGGRAPGKSAVVRVTDWLKRAARTEAVASVGFRVAAPD